MLLSNSIEKIEADIILACDMTQQIIESVSHINFEDIEVLNEKRLSLIESIFSNDKSNINVEMAKTLLTLNTQAMNKLKHQMAINIEEQQKFRKGNAAHNAYMNHAR